ncbi:unnamed protein product, partial [Porites evermanni]
MKILFVEPTWCLEETEKTSCQCQTWLGKRTDNFNNKRLFAKQHFGNMGRNNITGTPMFEYYPPSMHYVLRSAEKI